MSILPSSSSSSSNRGNPIPNNNGQRKRSQRTAATLVIESSPSSSHDTELSPKRVRTNPKRTGVDSVTNAAQPVFIDLNPSSSSDSAVPEEMTTLAYRYVQEEKDEEAFKLFTAASEQRYAPAIFELASYYWCGIVTEQDQAKALHLMADAADLGWEPAKEAYELLESEFKRHLVPEEQLQVEESVPEQQPTSPITITQNNAEAVLTPKENYLEGLRLIKLGTPEDLAKGIAHLKQAAKAGLKQAQSSLATRYRTGDGVKANVVKAIDLYTKAADQGFAQAQYNLALCYLKGTGVDKDEQRARELLEKAAEQGFARAAEQLQLLK